MVIIAAAHATMSMNVWLKMKILVVLLRSSLSERSTTSTTTLANNAIELIDRKRFWNINFDDNVLIKFLDEVIAALDVTSVVKLMPVTNAVILSMIVSYNAVDVAL
jgi:hypothetical protein